MVLEGKGAFDRRISQLANIERPASRITREAGINMANRVRATVPVRTGYERSQVHQYFNGRVSTVKGNAYNKSFNYGFYNNEQHRTKAGFFDRAYAITASEFKSKLNYLINKGG